jgi:hypothetical protein
MLMIFDPHLWENDNSLATFSSMKLWEIIIFIGEGKLPIFDGSNHMKLHFARYKIQHNFNSHG